MPSRPHAENARSDDRDVVCPLSAHGWSILSQPGPQRASGSISGLPVIGRRGSSPTSRFWTRMVTCPATTLIEHNSCGHTTGADKLEISTAVSQKDRHAERAYSGMV